MWCHVAASCPVLWLFLLVSGCWGQVNRLPFFTNHFFDTYLLISEDTPVGSSVTQLLARDMDNDPLGFGVSGEEVSRFFAVEPDTGVVWLRQPLDRETKSEFTVEFSVSDHQGVITRKVNIQVGDVNDNAPTFHNQPYSVRIPEVVASDRGTPPRKKDHILQVTILDVNDNPPVIESPFGYNVSVNENVGGGTAVVQVRATDRDAGINSVLSYYITEGNEDMTFRMDRISGEVATRPAPPNRERRASTTWWSLWRTRAPHAVGEPGGCGRRGARAAPPSV